MQKKERRRQRYKRGRLSIKNSQDTKKGAVFGKINDINVIITLNPEDFSVRSTSNLYQHVVRSNCVHFIYKYKTSHTPHGRRPMKTFGGLGLRAASAAPTIGGCAIVLTWYGNWFRLKARASAPGPNTGTSWRRSWGPSS